MRRIGIHLPRFRLSIAFSFAALGLVTCSILSPNTAPLLQDTPTFFPTPHIQKTNTKLPTFTRTLFPALTDTATPTGTPYPKDEWISLGPEGGEVWDIVIDPLRPATLYAVTWRAGMFKSLDGGKEWKSKDTGRASINQLIIDPSSPSTLYILSNNGGIYKSVNGGDTWKEIYPEHTSKPARPWIILLAIDPSTPSTLYAKNDRQQFLRSDDGGINWFVVGNVTEILGDFIIGVDVFLKVFPQNPTVLFLGTLEGLYRSNDGGASWMKTSLLGETNFLVADPESPDILYAGKDGALLTSTDCGAEWEMLQNGGFNVQDLAFDSENPSTLYAATGDPGFPFSANYKPDMAIRVSRDKGKHWDVVFQPGGIAINRIASDPMTPGTLYAGTSLGIFHTEDGGKQWDSQKRGLKAEEIGNMVIDPTTPCTLYCATWSNLIKSEDCGVHWTTINANIPDAPLPTGYLLMDYLHPSTLYLLSKMQFYKSLDRGVNWEKIKIKPFGEYISSVEMDPRNPEILYAVIDCGQCTSHATTLYTSTDGGGSWETIPSPAIVVWGLTLAPTIPTTIYASTSDGLYKSEDTGYQWQPVNIGLPEKGLEDRPIPVDTLFLIIDPVNPETLFVIFRGESIFTSNDGGES